MATRWDPIRDMDRLAGQIFGSVRYAGMPMDLYRAGEEYVLLADLPGVDPETIDISVEERVLTIRAERKDTAPANAQWQSHERPTGTYARQLSLGHGFALDKIDAEYVDGVLKLTIPVAEESKPRKIQVKPVSAPTTIEGVGGV